MFYICMGQVCMAIESRQVITSFPPTPVTSAPHPAATAGAKTQTQKHIKEAHQRENKKKNKIKKNIWSVLGNIAVGLGGRGVGGKKGGWGAVGEG